MVETGAIQMGNYEGRYCTVFYCHKMRGHVCCADCPIGCDNPCLNHPSRCNLSRPEEDSDSYMEGPLKNQSGNRRSFTDEQAFALWQQRKSDSEIGRELGVSRQMINKWRDTMELPSINKENVDTSHYRLVHNEYGTFVMKRNG